MTGAELRAARAALGTKWGLNRPLHASELVRLLRLRGRDPGANVLEWEDMERVSGPVQTAIEAMLRGFKPSTFREAIKR